MKCWLNGKRIMLILLMVFILSGCMPDETRPNAFVAPTVTPSKAPEIIVPSGAAVSNIFGIAYSSSGSKNPITGTSRLNSTFMPLLYEGLFYLDATFSAQPLLCDSITADGNAYILNLNTKAKFSDGTDLTAADVVYSLELARSALTIYAERLKDVVTIQALNEDSLRIELSRKVGRFELLLDVPIIKKNTAAEASPIGTGPFVWVETEEDSYLQASTSWWQNTLRPVSHIELVDSPEADLMINYFETGVLTMAINDPTATDPVVFGGDYEEWSYDTGILYYLGANAVAGPMSDAKIRRAIHYAVDRPFICETEMLRYAAPAVFPVNPTSRFYNKSLESEYAFSLDKFSSEISTAGYTPQSPLVINFVVNADNLFKAAVAERIAEDLRSMGVTVNLRALKWTDYIKALGAKDFDLYLAEVKLSSDFNLTQLVSKAGSLNYGGYSSDQTEQLLDAYIAADQASAHAVADAFYSKIAQDAPIIPILFKKGIVMAKRGVLTEIAPVQSNVFNGMQK